MTMDNIQAAARHSAKLACLELSDDELGKYAKKFESILSCVSKLNELDTKGIETASHAVEGVFAPLREDVAVVFENRETILNNAPKLKDNLFEVPKVIEND